MTRDDRRGPLDGVRVLDLSRMLPGGALTRLLVDLGAEVVKVERPGVGDELRADGVPIDGTTSTHAFLDGGKRSVALDLKDPADLELALALAAGSDAVVESFRPGVADRIGVGYAALRERNPAIVLCSVNGYGSGGPRDAVAGHDIGYCARAGVLASSGTRADGPAPSGGQLADLTGGLIGAVGLLAAIIGARATGVGDHVEVGLADAALWSVGIHAARVLAGDDTDGPEQTALNGAAPCYRAYRCADGRHLTVGALEPQFWRAFVDVAGEPSWTERRFDPSLVPAVAARIAERTLDEWTAAFAGHDACVEPVRRFSELRVDEQFLARGTVRERGDGTAVVGPPLTLGGARLGTWAASPTVGADGPAVVRDRGLPEADAVRLEAALGSADSGGISNSRLVG